MKVTSVEMQEKFKPFAINMKFDNKSEEEEFFALFCYGPITSMVPTIDDESIRSAIKKGHGDTPQYDDALDVLDKGFKP